MDGSVSGWGGAWRALTVSLLQEVGASWEEPSRLCCKNSFDSEDQGISHEKGRKCVCGGCTMCVCGACACVCIGVHSIVWYVYNVCSVICVHVCAYICVVCVGQYVCMCVVSVYVCIYVCVALCSV